MLIEFLQGALGAGAIGAAAYVGYAVGRHSSEEEDLRSATAIDEARRDGYSDGTRDAERRCDELYGNDWDAGYNAGLEAGRLSTEPDPVALSNVASRIRAHRLPWIHKQVEDHRSSYREVIWRLVEVARDIGERYRKVESLSQGGLVPIGDALNVCVYVADVVDHYNDHKILSKPHGGVFQGRAS